MEEARAAVERIIRDGHRVGEVIQRIRALATKTDPQRARLDLNDVIHGVVLLVHREVLGHRVSLQTDLAAGLPPVLGDRVQLQQVIINLVINGIDAMASVTERPHELLIRSHQPEAGQVCVAVQDADIGIDPAHMDRLFHAFFTTKPNGMGLGLSISRSIIEADGCGPPAMSARVRPFSSPCPCPAHIRHDRRQTPSGAWWWTRRRSERSASPSDGVATVHVEDSGLSPAVARSSAPAAPTAC